MIFIVITQPAWTQTDSIIHGSHGKYPKPVIDDMLFFIQKSSNTNTVVYQLNLSEDGVVDRKDPISVFWLRYQDQGQRKKLSFFERKFAYGVISKQIKNERNVFDIKLVALKSREFKLKRNNQGQTSLITKINGINASLSNIFLEIIEGSSFWPDVKYIDLYGLDLNTGQQIHERLFV